MQKFSFLLLLLVGYCGYLSAQEIIISEELTIRSDQEYRILGKYQEKFLLYRGETTTFEIQAFDENMGLSWSKNLELDDKRPEVLKVVGLEEFFYVIYRYRNKGNTVLKAHQYDAAANLVDSTIIFDYGKRFHTPTPEAVLSENREKVLLYYTEFFSEIEVVVFDLKKMKTLWNEKFSPQDMEFGGVFQQMLVDNRGGMHMVLIRDNDRLKKENPHYFEVFYHSEATDQTTTYQVGLDGKLTYDVLFKIDNLNRSLVAGGMHSEKNKGRTQGYYYLNIPINNPAEPVISFYNFQEAFMEQLVDNKSKVEKGIFDVGVQDIVLRQDGGIVIIGEQIRDFDRSSGTALSNRIMYDRMAAGRFSVDHYYDDLFLFSVHPDGTHHWESILPKKQHSQDDNGAFSSFFLAMTPRQLRLVYNDEIRNENTVSEYVVGGSGNYDRNSIFNTANQNLRLRFREGLQVAANEIVIPSEQRSRLKLVRMLF